MATILQSLKLRGKRARPAQAAVLPVPSTPINAAPAIDIAPNDPLVAYFLGNPAPLEVEKLNLDSPALQSMRTAGIKLAVPLVYEGLHLAAQGQEDGSHQ